MKNQIITFLFFFSVLVATAQDRTDDPMHRYLLNNGKSRWGLWGQLSGNFSPSGDKNLGWLGARIGTVYNDWFNFGLAGYGLYNENITFADDQGRQYRLEAATAGIFVEPRWNLTRRLSVGVSLYMGQGLAQYRYDKAYRAEMRWTEEIIDQVTFVVFEPGAGAEFRLAPMWAAGIGVTYRNTSPLNLWNTGDKVFQGLSAQVSLKFGLF